MTFQTFKRFVLMSVFFMTTSAFYVKIQIF